MEVIPEALTALNAYSIHIENKNHLDSTNEKTYNSGCLVRNKG